MIAYTDGSFLQDRHSGASCVFLPERGVVVEADARPRAKGRGSLHHEYRAVQLAAELGATELVTDNETVGRVLSGQSGGGPESPMLRVLQGAFSSVRVVRRGKGSTCEWEMRAADRVARKTAKLISSLPGTDGLSLVLLDDPEGPREGNWQDWIDETFHGLWGSLEATGEPATVRAWKSRQDCTCETDGDRCVKHGPTRWS